MPEGAGKLCLESILLRYGHRYRTLRCGCTVFDRGSTRLHRWNASRTRVEWRRLFARRMHSPRPFVDIRQVYRGKCSKRGQMEDIY